MHDNELLNNAIHQQNDTLSLELLDFEMARSPQNPYDNQEDEEIVSILQNREVVHSLEVIAILASYLQEPIDKSALSALTYKYGFEKLLNKP